MFNFKSIACFILHRTFGNVIYDIVQKYIKLLTSKLFKLEKLAIELEKTDLDITILSNFKIFNVKTKFLALNLPNTNDSGSRFIRKRLLRSALKKRNNEQYKFDKKLRKISSEVYGLLSSLDSYLVRTLIKKNFNRMVKTTVKLQEEKLKQLMRNLMLPFTPAETVLNLSGTSFSDDELEI